MNSKATTPFLLGFPLVVLNDRDEAEKVETVLVYEGDGEAGLWWNDSPLNTNKPFKDSFLNTSVEHLAKTVAVHFESKSVKAEEVANSQIEGKSAAMLCELMARYVFPGKRANASSLLVLLSARLDSQIQAQKLGEYGYVAEKVVHALETGAVLLLHPDDKVFVSEGIDPKPVPNSFEELWEEMAHSDLGQVFLFQLRENTARNTSDHPALDGLAKWLGLEKRGRIAKDGVDENPGRRPRLKDLLHLAIPSDPGSVGKILDKNQRAWDETANPGGMVEAALNYEGASSPQVELRSSGATSEQNKLFPTFGANSEFTHVLLGGPTGCGKTTVAELLVLSMAVEHFRPVIYIAPTRSLVNERYDKFIDRYCVAGVLDKRGVLRSSGEFPEDDSRIRSGDFKVAMIVYEKADLFLSEIANNGIGMVVIDEIHMLANEQRGGVLDTLLARILDANGKAEKICRIVGISTEQIASVDSVKNLLTYKDKRSREVPPIRIVAPERPVPLLHQLVWPNGDESIRIVEFKEEKDRHLESSEARKLIVKVQETLTKRSFSSGFETVKKNDGTFYEKLVPLVQKKSLEYGVVLVCVNSSFGTRRLADLHLRARSASSKNNKRRLPEGFELALRYMEDQKEERLFRDLAEQGIYVHVSDTHREIRQSIEHHFSQRHDSKAGLIIYTTETLTYGVNLSVDCVILADLKWPRVDYDSDDISPKRWLKPNEYHNLLGRAGRFGLADRGEALVCIEMFSDASEVIRRYYLRSSPGGEQLSNAILEADIRKLQKQTLAKIDDVSFPSLRTVITLMRHLGEGRSVRVRDILALFKNTLYYEAATEESRELAKDLVFRILELASAPNVRPPLVSKVAEDTASGHPDGILLDNTYQALPHVFALLDTGTQFASIWPIQRWLLRLRQIGVENPPVELVLPGLITARDFWLSARVYCYEQEKGNRDRGEEFFTKNDSEVEARLRDELRRLSISDHALESLIEAIREQAKECIERDDLGKTRREEFIEPMLMRLCAASLMWIRGEELGKIAELSNPENSESRKPFAQKYCDRLSWLVMFCWRCFADLSDVAPREFQTKLPRFSRRLMWGVPTEGIALRGGDSGGSRALRRETIRCLLSKHITPHVILTSRHPQDRFHNIVLDVEINARCVVDGVFEFFANECESIKDLMARRPKIDSHWRQYCDQIRQSLGLHGGTRDSGEGLVIEESAVRDANRMLLDLLKEGDGFGEEYQAGELYKDMGIRMTIGPNENIRFRLIGQSTENKTELPRLGDIVIWYPWRCQNSPGIESGFKELTALGALVLLAFFARGFIGRTALQSWSDGGRHGFWSIQDLLAYFSPERAGVRDIPGEIRERLLSFYEPGVADCTS
ncbi:MAG: DEAD/DEAH box helicase [Candidatus Hydrogenedentes bacterium]|nr:DEAD/DEAH box helicase [Candidatus Hydrogenedentota bacterium]